MQGNEESGSKASSWQGHSCVCLCAAQHCPGGPCAADLPGQLWHPHHYPNGCCIWYAPHQHFYGALVMSMSKASWLADVMFRKHGTVVEKVVCLVY